MSYCFTVEETVIDGVRRIAAEQLDEILSELADEATSVHERVHSARKHCKKVRGLLRLVRPLLGKTYQRENEAVRDAGRLLSAIRDSQTRLDAFDKLAKKANGELDAAAAAAIRQGLVARREDLVGDASDVSGQLEEFRDRIASMRARASQWKVKGDGPDAILAGLEWTYARGRRAMAAAYDDPSPELFHEWRKRVKDYWIHLLLIEDVWPPVLKAYSDQAKELADLLGDDHDLAVISDELQASPQDFGGAEAVEAFVALANMRRKQLQSEANVLGGRLFLAKPKEIARQFGKLWDAWKDSA